MKRPALFALLFLGILFCAARAAEAKPLNGLIYLGWEFPETGTSQAVLRDGRGKGPRLTEPTVPIQLYDLTANLAQNQPAVAGRLANALAAWDKESIDPVFLGPEGHNAAVRKAPSGPTS